MDMKTIADNVGQLLATKPAGYTKDDIQNMPPGELLNSSQRRSQSAMESGTGMLNGHRLTSSSTVGSGRARKIKKKQEDQKQILTENVDGYRGEADLEEILGFIESGDKKDKNGNKKSDKVKDGKKDAKNRKNGLRSSGDDDRSSRSERSGGRGSERRPSGRSSARAPPAGRSSSLEARPAPADAARGGASSAAAGRADATSVFCGDLAKSSLKKSDSSPATSRPPAVPTVVAFDGGTYVNPPPAERESEGFVQDFYSVTTDSTAIEETEFHVVTRKQRKRGGGRSGTTDPSRPHALRYKTSSLDESARARHDSLGQPRRPYVPGLRHTTSSSAPHSELSDSDSDGAGSLPPPPPPPSLVDPGGGRSVRVSPPPNTAAAAAAAHASAPASGGGGGGGGGSSWADVTRNRQENHAHATTPTATQPAATAAVVARTPKSAACTRDAETSTDFIDGVGPIFGERSSPKGRPVAAVAAFVRGSSEPADGLIGGSHPDEFPEIAPAPAPAAAAAKSPRAGTASASPASASSVTVSAVSPPAAATSQASPQGTIGVSVTTTVAASSQTDVSLTIHAAFVPAPAAPASPVAAPAAAAAPAVSAPPAAAAPRAAAAPTAGPDTSAAPPGLAAPLVPAALPSSGANSAGDRRTPADPAPSQAPSPAPAPAPAPARRVKKPPAVTIPGTFEDVGTPGGSRAHVQGIQFGYIDTCSEPAPARTAAAPPEPPAGAVEVFCRRFRPPPVDVTRFNWGEISIYLNKVYDDAARDPKAFFVSGDAASAPAPANGLRSPAAARPVHSPR